ncbi:MAG: thymidine phosphorylase [Burkholderiales bacterium]|nr:thymidine phosphorylase [Burkholderiales bacterium]
MRLPQQVIAAKRDGGTLAPAQIDEFVAGLVAGPQQGWSDAQAAAMAMAICCRGMDGAETVALTHAMTRSGRVLDWRAEGFGGPVLDKHSTGGVGDKVSLMLAPLLAEAGADAGVIVPMVSGRGLGHTGGTLDKLEALPGYGVNPAHETLVRVLRDAGCAIVGASADLAPADRRLYAIRDVTATVESVPLITASILSKKLAAGLSALVLDVKVGSGAMMPTLAAARALAQSLVDVAAGAGLPARALVTDMDRLLGCTAGNGLEVQEAIAFLAGLGPHAREPRLLELTLTLAAHALQLGGVAADLRQARARAEAALAGGGAAERFARMVAALGGPRDVLKAPGLATAPVQFDVLAARGGRVRRVDVRALGMAVVALGGGRRHGGERIDPRVGLSQVAAPGQQLSAGEPLAHIFAADAATAEAVSALVAAAFTLDEEVAAAPFSAEPAPAGQTAAPLVHEVIAARVAPAVPGAPQSRP